MKKQTILLACSALFLASCGGTSATSSASQDDGASVAPADVTISQQFIAHFGDLASYGMDYYAILNLYSDGTVQLSGYDSLKKDVSDYKENKGFSYDWGHGKWKVGQDEEGEEATIISYTYGEDQTNVMTGKPNVGTYKYSVYPKSNGSASFTCDLPIISGRQAQMVSDGTVQYADYNEFIKAHKYTFTEPTNAYAHLDDDTNGCRIYVLPDHVAQWVHGGSSTNVEAYSDFTSGTWSNVDGAFTLKFGSEEKAATISEKTATVILTYDATSGYSEAIQATFTGDITNVPVDDASDVPAEPEVLATWTTAEGGHKYECYDDHSGIFYFHYEYQGKTGDLKENSTWKFEDGIFTVTVSEGKVFTSNAVSADQLTATWKYTYSANGTGDVDYEFSGGYSIWSKLM